MLANNDHADSPMYCSVLLREQASLLQKEEQQLRDFWAEYPRAYLGTSLPDFPNLFIVTSPNTGIGHTSALFIIESQMNYILDCIRTLKEHRLRSIEVRSEAERTYTEMIHREMERTVWKSGGCHSWYQSKSGHVIALSPVDPDTEARRPHFVLIS